jgi:archaellum component FlaF (FlaF/FlaG flagellin family)
MKGRNRIVFAAAFLLWAGFAAPARGQAILSPDKLLIRCVNGQCNPASTTLTNIGSQTVTLSSITLSGGRDFTETNNCSSSLKPGQSCTITIDVSPSIRTSTGVLTVNDSAPNSPQTAYIKVIVKQGS